mgnify:CR=1 FL=1
MKRHPCNISRTNAHRSTYPIGGKIFLATVFFLLAVSQPLFGQPLTGLESPGQQVYGEESDVIEAGAEILPDTAEADRIACFDRVWSAYQDDVWFYGEKGQHTVPAMDLEWLVVRLVEKGKAHTGTPPSAFEDCFPKNGDLQTASFDSFNARYNEYFSHFLHDPAVAPAMAAYRLRRDMPEKVFRTLMTRLQQDRQVMYVHPAWKIADRLFAPLEKIEIVWKTSSDMRQRRALLEAVGAIVSDDSAVSNPQQIAISPYRQSVWQSANLLTEDILVEQARPLLMVLEPPVGVRFELGMNGAIPGTPIPFTLEMRFSDRVKIESSTIANLNIKPAGIFHNLYDIRYDAPLSSIDINRSPIRITGDIRIYATGEYSLPGIPVYYTDSRAPKSRVRLVKTAGEPVRIAAMIPTTAAGFELQAADFGSLSTCTPAMAQASTFPSVLFLIAGMTFAGLSVVTTWLLREKYRQPAIQIENHILKRSRARVDAAVTALQRQRDMAELAELGVSLKEYLAEFAGLDEERRGGSHASFLRRIEAALPATCRTTTAELLSLIEHLYARGEQNAIPEDLAGRVGRFVEGLHSAADPRQDPTEKP